MAIVAGLLPWTAEEVDLGIVRCMARWVQLRGNTDTVGELARAAVLFQRDLVSSLAAPVYPYRQKQGRQIESGYGG